MQKQQNMLSKRWWKLWDRVWSLAWKWGKIIVTISPGKSKKKPSITTWSNQPLATIELAALKCRWPKHDNCCIQPDLILWLVPRCPYHSESSVMVSRRNAPASQPCQSVWSLLRGIQELLTQSTYTYIERQKERERERGTRGKFVDTDL